MPKECACSVADKGVQASLVYACETGVRWQNSVTLTGQD